MLTRETFQPFAFYIVTNSDFDLLELIKDIKLCQVEYVVPINHCRVLQDDQPHRRLLPVVTPNSAPTSWRWFPILSRSSVGNGPPPTLVVYAFITPMVLSIRFGGIPNPVQTPPIEVLDDVTNGYVPKSRSSMSAFAPSMRIRFFSASALWI